MPVNTMQEVGQKILPAQQLSQLNQHVENNETTTVEVHLVCMYLLKRIRLISVFFSFVTN